MTQRRQLGAGPIHAGAARPAWNGRGRSNPPHLMLVPRALPGTSPGGEEAAVTSASPEAAFRAVRSVSLRCALERKAVPLNLVLGGVLVSPRFSSRWGRMVPVVLKEDILVASSLSPCPTERGLSSLPLRVGGQHPSEPRTEPPRDADLHC